MPLSRPQRISRPEPIGSLLKRITAAAPRRGLAEPEGGDRAHLEQVRTLPCLSCGMEPSEACHVKFSCAALGKTNKLGRRPSDSDTVPLCSQCHRLARDAQHQGSERLFWLRLDLNPYLIARDLYAQRRDPVAMRAVVLVAISRRQR